MMIPIFSRLLNVSVRQACSFLALILLLFPGVSRGGILGMYDLPLGAEDAWSVANASSGVALDTGLIGGYGNPAAYVTDRNEIYGEGSAWGTFSVQNRVSPADISYGAGTIGYLTSYSNSSLVFVYQARSQLDRGARYGETQIVNTQNYTDIGVAYAHTVGEELTAGAYFGSLRGTSFSGTLLNSTDLDTIFTPRLWTLKLGLQDRSDSWKWGTVLEFPAIGTFMAERPVNVARKRTNEAYTFRGPWIVRTGVGREKQNGTGFEVELQYAYTGFIRRGDDPLSANDHQLQLGVSGRGRVDDQLRLTAGVNYRFLDGSDQPAFLLGFGGDYALTENVMLFGGAGIYFPTSAESNLTALDDVRPWIARGGIMFFERE
ncbi:transporter [bacterium]|nr:transporter [bacterium]